MMLGATIILVTFAGLFGLAIGSFLNVVVWRLPRGESLSSPPSACPKCGHAIRARDNVPVLGWLLLRGKCRDCGEPISPRYPIVEAVHRARRSPSSPSSSASSRPPSGRCRRTSISRRSRSRSPSSTSTPAGCRTASSCRRSGSAPSLLALASWASGDWGALLRAVIGSAGLFALYFVIAFISPRGMGMGDVKLAAVLGLYLGWLGWGPLAVGAFAAFLLGGVFAVALLIARRARRGTAIPFGPWMIAGAWLGIAGGAAVWNEYLGTFGLV